MDRLTTAAIGKIEQIHSKWIELEIAGEDRKLIDLCTSDIEFWPPDAPPVRGPRGSCGVFGSGNRKNPAGRND